MGHDKLQEESKKLGLGFKDQSQNSTPAYIERLYNWFISQLLIPREFSYDIRFNLKREMVAKLCDEVEKILEDEPVLIHLKAPLKIYGNLNGQMGDLMKLFEHFGMPCDSQLQGDIEGFTYLFLGDYVDLGRYSVEVICLLLSFKYLLINLGFLITKYKRKSVMMVSTSLMVLFGALFLLKTV